MTVTLLVDALSFFFFFFFFQAEDGIRDYKVTGVQTCALPIYLASVHGPGIPVAAVVGAQRAGAGLVIGGERDRKSTRLNSSHLVISYAVFCLKKKKNTEHLHLTPVRLRRHAPQAGELLEQARR